MKKWYASKTIWVNFLAILGIVLERQFDLDILSDEMKTSLLVLINVVLRMVTNKAIDWK